MKPFGVVERKESGGECASDLNGAPYEVWYIERGERAGEVVVERCEGCTGM